MARRTSWSRWCSVRRPAPPPRARRNACPPLQVAARRRCRRRPPPRRRHRPSRSAAPRVWASGAALQAQAQPPGPRRKRRGTIGGSNVSWHTECQALRGLPRNACGARPKSFPIVTMLAVSPQQCLIQTRRPRSRNQGRETTMIDAAVKALVQMFSPPFRSVLLKSAGLALALIVLIAIALQRLLVWLTTAGADWAETVFGISAHAPLSIFIWVVSIAAGLGIIVGSVFLMPAVTALVGSFFVDDIALEVERRHYPDEPVGTPLPFLPAMLQGTRTALLAVAIYIIALPSLLIAGLGAVIFFIAAAYLLGREYFGLAAMRYRSAAHAKMLRKQNQGMVFIAGLVIAAFVSIPIISLATPLFAMALMVHVHKRIMIGGQLTNKRW